MKRILLLGRDGQVGWELQRCLAPTFGVLAVGRSDVDLSSATEISAAIRAYQPQIIINAAAYTAVDRAESDEAAAAAVNAHAPEALAAEARSIGALLIHYSTDYVFDGEKSTPYVEDDPTNPLGVYAKTKRLGEMAIEASGCAYFIFRTSWVYGARGTNFLLTMLRLANSTPTLRVVADQFGVPNWSRLIAEATTAILLMPHHPDDQRRGIYHLTARGQTSWHGFADAIVARGSHLGLCQRVPVVPISTREYPTPTLRPLNSVLASAKVASTFGVSIPEWETCLDWCMQDMAAARSLG